MPPRSVRWLILEQNLELPQLLILFLLKHKTIRSDRANVIWDEFSHSDRREGSIWFQIIETKQTEISSSNINKLVILFLMICLSRDQRADPNNNNNNNNSNKCQVGKDSVEAFQWFFESWFNFAISIHRDRIGDLFERTKMLLGAATIAKCPGESNSNRFGFTFSLGLCCLHLKNLKFAFCSFRKKKRKILLFVFHKEQQIEAH